MSEKGKDTGNV